VNKVDRIGKKGSDLAVAIPRFVKGNPAEAGKKVVDAVSRSTLLGMHLTSV